MLGISQDDGEGIVQVLTERFWVLARLMAMLKSVCYGLEVGSILQATAADGHRWVDMARRIMGAVGDASVHAVRAFYLQGVGVDIQLVGAQTAVRIRVAGEVEGQGAGGQLGGRSKGPRDEAPVAGEACWGGAVGAGAAVQDLGQVAAAVNVNRRSAAARARAHRRSSHWNARWRATCEHSKMRLASATATIGATTGAMSLAVSCRVTAAAAARSGSGAA
jgi:hypothetical protein